MRNIILIIFIIILFSFKSYENAIDNELKKFMVGQLQILELAKDKKNISNLELVIIDDFSSDGTTEIIRELNQNNKYKVVVSYNIIVFLRKCNVIELLLPQVHIQWLARDVVSRI